MSKSHEMVLDLEVSIGHWSIELSWVYTGWSSSFSRLDFILTIKQIHKYFWLNFFWYLMGIFFVTYISVRSKRVILFQRSLIFLWYFEILDMVIRLAWQGWSPLGEDISNINEFVCTAVFWWDWGSLAIEISYCFSCVRWFLILVLCILSAFHCKMLPFRVHTTRYLIKFFHLLHDQFLLQGWHILSLSIFVLTLALVYRGWFWLLTTAFVNWRWWRLLTPTLVDLRWLWETCVFYLRIVPLKHTFLHTHVLILLLVKILYFLFFFFFPVYKLQWTWWSLSSILMISIGNLKVLSVSLGNCLLFYYLSKLRLELRWHDCWFVV